MKVLYTATVLSHICQFHLPCLQAFQARGWEVHVAARDNLGEKNGLKLRFCDRLIPIPFQRSPLARENLRALKELKTLIREEKYDLILCNTPMGGILTRLAAKSARKRGTKVVYMAHGFHFYQGAPKKNWLVYYPIERTMARLCDLVITITEEDYALAREKFPCPAAHIHGVGVSPERYHPASPEAIREMRRREGVGETDFLVLCTGELNRNKSQGTLIDAAAALKERIPGLRILLAGNGPMEAELRKKIGESGMEDRVNLLGYRTDLETLTPAADLIVSCSHREGLPLNILEGMLCAKPVIATENRGHRELVEDGVTGYRIPTDAPEALAEKILELYAAPERRADMGRRGLEKARAYTVSAVKEELKAALDSLGLGETI